LVIYGFKVGNAKVDLAVTSDRHNDMVRVFAIDPDAAEAPAVIRSRRSPRPAGWKPSTCPEVFALPGGGTWNACHDDDGELSQVRGWGRTISRPMWKG
jgi:hypothetical protein